MTDRCEPPEALRDVSGWHWVQYRRSPPFVAAWCAHEDGGNWDRSEMWGGKGFRYLCPVPTPSDLAAAKDREAALVAENVKLRELAGRVCNAWDAIGGALETSSDVDDFNECEQATFELRSMLDGETP